MVRASRHGLERGLTTCMMLAWDVSRTGGHGGIRLDWEERRGWYYALLGLSLGHVTLYSVIPVLRTPIASPQEVAAVAEELVHHRRLPEREFWTEWDGAREVRAAADDFRRGRLGLGLFNCGKRGPTVRRRPGPGAAENRHPDRHLRAGGRGTAGRVRAWITDVSRRRVGSACAHFLRLAEQLSRSVDR